MNGASEAELDINKMEWSSMRMPRAVFLEEYDDFVRMGMSLQEIARAFNTSIDALEHRLRRYKVWTSGGGVQLKTSRVSESRDGFGSRISPSTR